MSRAPALRIGIVGRGRAATTLHPRLAQAGMAPLWWWSRGEAGGPLELPQVEVVLLAVPDAAIADAARALARRPGAVEEIWLHLAGSRPAALARADGHTPRAAGLFHPLAALPGPTASPDLLRGATAGLAGDPDAVAAGHRLAAALEMHPLALDPSTQPLYHAAAVTVAGHLTALVSQAVTMLCATGMSAEQAQRALSALALGALKNLDGASPADAITGPIARGDVATVRAHLAQLDRLDGHLADTYRRLARTALELSRARLSPADSAALEALLDRS
jgi:predicted short-subunit dehydrogenase-like oxidoreductase (DUF2520 family)